MLPARPPPALLVQQRHPPLPTPLLRRFSMSGGRLRLRTAAAGLFAAAALLAVFYAPGVYAPGSPAAPEAAQPAPAFALQPGDHVCIIGNTLADRMQHDGWLETALYARFPTHNLTVRNLGFSGDEVGGYTANPDPV